MFCSDWSLIQSYLDFFLIQGRCLSGSNDLQSIGRRRSKISKKADFPKTSRCTNWDYIFTIIYNINNNDSHPVWFITKIGNRLWKPHCISDTNGKSKVNDSRWRNKHMRWSSKISHKFSTVLDIIWTSPTTSFTSCETGECHSSNIYFKWISIFSAENKDLACHLEHYATWLCLRIGTFSRNSNQASE